MSKFVNINNLNTPYGPDHWLLAYEWYDRSIRMVEQGIDETGPVERRRKEMLFYNYRPAQLRNMALALQSEFRADEYMVELWQRAHDEWVAFGNQPLNVILQVDVTMESLLKSGSKIQKLRRELDDIVPGARKRLLDEGLAKMTDEDRLMLGRPVDSLTDEEFERVQLLEKELYGTDLAIDQQIANMASRERMNEIAEILKPLAEEAMKLRMGHYFRATVNYEQWKKQSSVEASEKGISARQAEFDAMELRDQSIFDEYEKRDPVSGEAQTLPGSIQKFDEAFTLWSEIIETEPQLRVGPMFDDITFAIEKYMVVREVAGEDAWPDDFVLQHIIDYRAGIPQTHDNFPLTADVAERAASRNKDRRYRMPKRPNIEFQLKSESADEDQKTGDDNEQQ